MYCGLNGYKGRLLRTPPSAIILIKMFIAIDILVWNGIASLVSLSADRTAVSLT